MDYEIQKQLKQLAQALQIPEAIHRGAACKGTDPTIMDGETFENIKKAQAICSGCPVFDICKEWAVWHEPNGVWAGTLPKQRAKLRNGKPIIDVVEMNGILAKSANLFSGKTVCVLAEEYGVTERTIYRWRAAITDQRWAS